MELLAKFWHVKPHLIEPLPVIPDSYLVTRQDQSGIVPIVESFANNFKALQGIFDAAAIGQYLFGVDARNNPLGESQIGFINESAIYRASDFAFYFENINGNQVPMASYRDAQFRIYNLHIHSKIKPSFI